MAQHSRDFVIADILNLDFVCDSTETIIDFLRGSDVADRMLHQLLCNMFDRWQLQVTPQDVNNSNDILLPNRIDAYSHLMGLGSKILASLAILSGTAVFILLLFLDPSFQSLFWQLTGRNILYTSVGVIGVFASIIAIANWLWNR